MRSRWQSPAAINTSRLVSTGFAHRGQSRRTSWRTNPGYAVEQGCYSHYAADYHTSAGQRRPWMATSLGSALPTRGVSDGAQLTRMDPTIAAVSANGLILTGLGGLAENCASPQVDRHAGGRIEKPPPGLRGGRPREEDPEPACRPGRKGHFVENQGLSWARRTSSSHRQRAYSLPHVNDERRPYHTRSIAHCR